MDVIQPNLNTEVPISPPVPVTIEPVVPGMQTPEIGGVAPVVSPETPSVDNVSVTTENVNQIISGKPAPVAAEAPANIVAPHPATAEISTGEAALTAAFNTNDLSELDTLVGTKK